MKITRCSAFLRQALAGVIFLSFLPVPISAAGLSADLPRFVKEDRVLILAPHPDDETIAAAGVMQEAAAVGAKVKVVLLTNGENNLWSFMVYDKRFFFGPKRMIRMGALRKQETLNALKKLGVAENNVVSLGYPDGGILQIMTGRWGKVKPFRAEFSRAKQVPYSDALLPGAPYSGESILKDLEQVLLEYKPTRIFVSHPADRNPDHQGLYLFMRVALWELEGKINLPEIYPYLVHANGWPLPQGYHPELNWTFPPTFADRHLFWRHLALRPGEVSNKYEALREYPSQIQYAPRRLVSFVRQEEVFSDYPVIKIGQPADSAALVYAKQGDRLMIHLKLKRALNQWRGISIFLLGYKKGAAFSTMPKIEIHFQRQHFHIKDKREGISVKDVTFISHGKERVLSIPLSLLGDPDFILCNAQTKLKDLSMDEKAWRILELDPSSMRGKDE